MWGTILFVYRPVFVLDQDDKSQMLFSIHEYIWEPG